MGHGVTLYPPPMGQACRALNARGEPCSSTSVDESGLCASHAGKGRFGTVEFSRRGGKRSAEARRERAVERRMTALDWAAKLVEERGQELAESFLNAAKNGDWRAAEALMSRIYGKPTETVVTHTPVSPEKALIASMTLEEKLELLHSLRRGEQVALPVVEGARRQATSLSGSPLSHPACTANKDLVFAAVASRPQAPIDRLAYGGN
jgi:hypothetical protein